MIKLDEYVLAHDSDWSVSSAHLILGDHIQHLDERASVWYSVRRPLSQVKLCHYKSIILRRALLCVGAQ